MTAVRWHRVAGILPPGRYPGVVLVPAADVGLSTPCCAWAASLFDHFLWQGVLLQHAQTRVRLAANLADPNS
jgi:hypothetical protein